MNPVNSNATVSLCMIVKNEEEFLPQCLESVKHIVDEIVVVDTGSTDRTVEIAGRYGAMVKKHAWEDDFSQARNLSLEYATKDWILVMDADETLGPNQNKKILALLGKDGINAVSVLIHNVNREGKMDMVFNSVRMFRNNGRAKYEGIVHNRLICPGPTNPSDIKIFHHGYGLEKEKQEAKHARTERLLKKDVSERPSDPLPHHYLAYLYMSMGQPEKAERSARVALKLIGEEDVDPALRVNCLYILASLALKRGKIKEALSICEMAGDKSGHYLDIQGLLACIYFELKAYESMNAAADRFIGLHKKVKRAHRGQGFQFNNLYAFLDAIYFYKGFYAIEKGDFGEAVHYFDRSLSQTPSKTKMRLRIIQACMEQDHFTTAEQYCKQILDQEPDHRYALLSLAKIYDRQGKPKQSITCLERLNTLYPDEFKLERMTPDRGRNPERRILREDGLPSISLCMIVKNEERLLPKCLESIDGWVDEIVIVDTGSEDKTEEIAERHGARLYFHEWKNDFSQARNISLSHARGDWILVLDADEWINQADAKELHQAVKGAEGANGIVFSVYSPYTQGKGLSMNRQIRLIRNREDIFYEGIVHNRLKISGRTVDTDLKVYHEGYNLSSEEMEAKFRRTSTLLKEAIAEKPDDPVLYYYLAAAYQSRNLFDDVIKTALKGLEVCESRPEEPFDVLKSALGCLAASGLAGTDDQVKALEMAHKAYDTCNQNLDALGLISSIYFQKKDFENFKLYNEEYLKLAQSAMTSPSSFQFDLGFQSLNDIWLAHLRQAIYHWMDGDQEAGNLHLKEAIQRKDEETCLLSMGKYFFENSRTDLAKKCFNRILKKDPDHEGALVFLLEISELEKETEATITLFERLFRLNPENVTYRYRYGLHLYNRGRFDRAEEQFTAVLQEDFSHAASVYYLSRILINKGDYHTSKELLENFLNIFPNFPEATHLLTQLNTLIQKNQTL